MSDRYDADGVPRDMRERRIWAFRLMLKAIGLGLLVGLVLVWVIILLAAIFGEVHWT